MGLVLGSVAWRLQLGTTTAVLVCHHLMTSIPLHPLSASFLSSFLRFPFLNMSSLYSPNFQRTLRAGNEEVSLGGGSGQGRERTEKGQLISLSPRGRSPRSKHRVKKWRIWFQLWQAVLGFKQDSLFWKEALKLLLQRALSREMAAWCSNANLSKANTTVRAVPRIFWIIASSNY